MNMQELFNIPYPRPEQFTVPDNAWPNPGEIWRIDKPNEAFNWSEFKAIFDYGPFQAQYIEAVYFLPWAFEEMVRNPIDSCEYFEGVTCFCDFNRAHLIEDGIWGGIEIAFRFILESWTEHSVVQHDTAHRYLKGEQALDYHNDVYHSDIVNQLIHSLINYETLKPVAEAFVSCLSEYGNDYTKAAWLLEFAKSKKDVYHPHDSELIMSLITDRVLLERAFEIVKRKPIESHLMKLYWEDTLKELGLDANKE